MSIPSKPILHNGYEVNKNVTITSRIEKVFFTEIYKLSDGNYLYLFTNLKLSDIRGGKDKLIKITHQGNEYLGIVTSEHSQEHVTQIIDGLTQLKGFASVAGMKELKHILMNDVIQPLLNPEKYEKFKLSLPNGILLYGPPGCGKTFIVRKLAEELGYNFVEVKHSDIASSYIHGTVGKVGRLFEMAKLKAPSIVFIDEIEGLIPKRESMGSEFQHKQEEVNEFLMQLNDAGKNKVLVVAATNRPQLIDTALLRAGRMDKRILVSPPDLEARIELFKLFLSERPISVIDYQRLAELTEYYVSADIELIVTEAARDAVELDRDFIDQAIIEDTIKSTTPSILEEEIEYYKQFQHLERS
ncbi:ATP-binding protein [Candidatus Saccharibacteria bacterium]|nr:ATP-binding protein [Candidatus Saccharibacteria bacterium]